MRSRLITLVAVTCICGFAAIVAAADRGALPDMLRRLYDWPGGDKVGHVVLLALLTLAVGLALRELRLQVGRWSARLASAVVAVGITLEEASQAWIPGRTLSLADLVCSYLGIFLGARAVRALLACTDELSRAADTKQLSKPITKG